MEEIPIARPCVDHSCAVGFYAVHGDLGVHVLK
jgi:hypothetical protein